MPAGTLSRILWMVIVIAIVVFGLKARDNFENYFAGVGTLEVTPPDAGGTLVLEWRGKVEAPMARKISEALDTYESEARRVVLSLSSPGGSLGEGRAVIGILQRVAGRRQLETNVKAGRLCASMCVPIYLQGEERTAAAGSRFMFHQVRFRDFYEGEDDAVPAAAKEEATEQLFSYYFIPAGVPERWIAQIEAEMAGGRDVWRTGAQLVDERANIVQRIE